jgi:hypothetical protein
MKKVITILVVLLSAAPALARVDITCSAWADEITLSFDASTEAKLIRAFALDIEVDNGAKIIEVKDVNEKYNVHPGSFTYDDVNGIQGDVVAANDYPGTKTGLDTNAITIEMGSLYHPPTDSSPNAPGNQGTILTFVVDNDCNVTFTENVIRSGVVRTDACGITDFNAPLYHHVGCLTAATAVDPCSVNYYAEWNNVGRPACWCYPRQCHGDADGKKNRVADREVSGGSTQTT